MAPKGSKGAEKQKAGAGANVSEPSATETAQPNPLEEKIKSELEAYFQTMSQPAQDPHPLPPLPTHTLIFRFPHH